MIKSNIKQRLECLDINKSENWYGKGTYMKTYEKEDVLWKAWGGIVNVSIWEEVYWNQW